MIRKIAVLALLMFFMSGILTAMAGDEPAPKSKGAAQSIYNWFGGWDKGRSHAAAKQAGKPAGEANKPAVKPVSRGNNITQSAYNWFGTWDKLCVSERDRCCKSCERACCNDCNIDCGGTCCPKCVPVK